MNNKGIYKIVCKINGITYIGSTETSFDKRWKKHKQRLRNNKHENDYLQNTWNKYGEENFEFEIIEDISDIESIRKREAYWLSLYFPKGRDYCFNLSDHTCGGNTVKDPEARKKLSESVKASYTPELRKLRSEQGKLRSEELSIRMKELTSTDEWKEKNAEKNKKQATDSKWLASVRAAAKKRGKKVGTDRGEEFESLSDAERQTGATRSNIRSCINGKYKSCLGRKWFYIEK